MSRSSLGTHPPALTRSPWASMCQHTRCQQGHLLIYSNAAFRSVVLSARHHRHFTHRCGARTHPAALQIQQPQATVSHTTQRVRCAQARLYNGARYATAVPATVLARGDGSIRRVISHVRAVQPTLRASGRRLPDSELSEGHAAWNLSALPRLLAQACKLLVCCTLVLFTRAFWRSCTLPVVARTLLMLTASNTVATHRYEFLPTTDPPVALQSPATTLWNQRGNCFDFSVLLCALLEGAGYDAYVVHGYATREVCLLDRSRQDVKEETTEPEVPEPVVARVAPPNK